MSLKSAAGHTVTRGDRRRMVGKKNEAVPLGQRSVQYRRARWKHWARYFGVGILVMLNISLVASNIELRTKNRGLDPVREAVGYLVVLFFDVTILLPVLLEVDMVDIKPDSLTLNGMFSRRKLNWKDITYFNSATYLTYAILKSGKSIYLLNKKDLQPHEELVEIIQFKRAKAIQ
jgi:hypothetical protein